MSESPVDPNPYAAPEADLKHPPISESADLSESEAIRRRYLGHEAAVKSIGSLFDLSALLLGFSFVIGIVQASGLPSGAFGFLELILLGGFLVFTIAMGRGFARLRAWARWMAALLVGCSTAFSLLVMAMTFFTPSAGISTPRFVFAIQSAIPAYVLYLLLSSKSSFVFSEEYRRIVRETPHVKYRTSRLLLWILVGIVLVVIVGGVLFFTMG